LPAGKGFKMKIFKIILGTIFGLCTICYITMFIKMLILFIRYCVMKGYSAQGLSQTAGAFAAMCAGIAFTAWTFESAFKSKTSAQEKNIKKDEIQNG
jgi:hypothetical protein